MEQARSMYIQAEKLHIRSLRLATWAEDGLIPKWAVGEGPIPPHLVMDPTIASTLNEVFTKQAVETLTLLSSSLEEQSIAKENEAHALWKGIEELYKEGPIRPITSSKQT